LNGGRKPRTPPSGSIVAALDVGTTKVCCLIGRVGDAGAVRVIGVGHQASLGVRAGVIVDIEAAAGAIASAVHAAEEMSGETVNDVVVNLSGGQLGSRMVSVEVDVLDQEVSETDLQRALAQSRAHMRLGDGELLHAVPLGYTLDGSDGIRDPRGMFGERLGVRLHLVTASPIPVRNLTTCLARTHLDAEAVVASPYAAGLACLVDDELDLGVTVIDMGGGTTTVAVFLDNHLVFTDSIPVGGGHVTSDIARGLNTPLAHAERMKSLYGSAISSSVDEHELIDVPQVGEDAGAEINQVPRSLLVGIIQPRLEETFELVRSRLEQSGYAKSAGRRVVLTGGGSQLPGVRELGQLLLDKQVRLGRPVRVDGLNETSGGPAFTTAAGLLLQGLRPTPELTLEAAAMPLAGGLLGRVGMWLRAYL